MFKVKPVRDAGYDHSDSGYCLLSTDLTPPLTGPLELFWIHTQIVTYSLCLLSVCLSCNRQQTLYTSSSSSRGKKWSWINYKLNKCDGCGESGTGLTAPHLLLGLDHAQHQRNRPSICRPVKTEACDSCSRSSVRPLQAILETAFTRVVLPMPIFVLPPILMSYLER